MTSMEATKKMGDVVSYRVVTVRRAAKTIRICTVVTYKTGRAGWLHRQGRALPTVEKALDTANKGMIDRARSVASSSSWTTRSWI
jgi:exosome complex RNA-binding protein Csl4